MGWYGPRPRPPERPPRKRVFIIGRWDGVVKRVVAGMVWLGRVGVEVVVVEMVVGGVKTV